MRHRGVSISGLCKRAGITRQNYYKGSQVKRGRKIDEELILHMVRGERCYHPRLGVRKLHFLIRREMEEAGVYICRDRLFALLREHDLLVPPLPKAPRTTNSRHTLPVFRNLILDVEPTGPNQVWVSDITYIRTDSGFVYLVLITDRYSRKIVGYSCGDTLEASGCVEALRMAEKGLPSGYHPIHHSDRGSQYCCHEYVEQLKRMGLQISMTEQNHCYENAHAERVNGILKQEYGLGSCFRSPAQARQAVKQAVWLYNVRRPHSSLQMRVPEAVHQAVA